MLSVLATWAYEQSSMAVSTAPIGSGAFAHVEDRRRAAPHDRGTGTCKLVDGDACQTFRRMLCDRAQHGNRCCRACQRHGYDLGRDACPGQGDQIAAAKIAPDERRRRTHVKDGTRFFTCSFCTAGERRQHVDHFLDGLVCERAGDNRLFGIQQGQIQAVRVLNVLWHFMANDSRGLGVILRDLLCNLEQADQVCGFGSVMLQGFGVEHGNA